MTMKSSKYLYLLSLLCLCFSLVPVSRSLALSLDECVALALRNNPELHKQQLQLDASHIDISEQKGQQFGRLELVSSYTHYNLPHTLAPLTPGSIIANPTAVPTTEDLFTTGIIYEVSLFTGFAHTSSIEVAKLQKELAAAALKLSREQLVYNVKTLYVQILSLQAQELAQRAYVESLRQLYEQVSRELQLGQKARIDQLKTAADLGNARTAEAQISANISILKASLASLLDIDQIPPLAEIELTQEAMTTVDDDFSSQISDSQRLRSARLVIDKNARLADKVAASLYPQIVLNTSYGQNFGPNDSSHRDSGDWNNQEVWQAGLVLRWNLFDFDSTRSKMKKARIIEQQSRYEQTQTELELKRAITEAVTRINIAVNVYRSSRSELEMTRQTAAIEQVRFDQGAASINDLLYARARNQLAESRFIDAGYSYKIANFHLEYLLESGEK